MLSQIRPSRDTPRGSSTAAIPARRGRAERNRMRGFLGTHQNRIDAKGRVSIPAPFRAELRAPAADGPCRLVLRPSHKHACIEAWPEDEFERLAAPLDRLQRFSEAHEDLSTSLYSAAHPVESDREGRIVLPDWIGEHAGLSDAVVFMGLGPIFQIWEPAAAKARMTAARERVRTQQLSLPGAAP